VSQTWTSGDKSLHVNVCVIIKRRKNKFGRWEYQALDCFHGEWNDLVYDLYEKYGRFKEEVDYITNKAALHDKLDEIADRLARHDTAYEFVLPDRTDDWYVAYVKPAVFRIDADGSLR
jgi:hypothetical protein